MKKFLLLLAMVCFLAPVVTVSAASTTNTNFIISFFSKKTKKAQPKFRPQSRAVYKIK